EAVTRCQVPQAAQMTFVAWCRRGIGGSRVEWDCVSWKLGKNAVLPRSGLVRLTHERVSDPQPRDAARADEPRTAVGDAHLRGVERCGGFDCRARRGPRWGPARAPGRPQDSDRSGELRYLDCLLDGSPCRAR